ncbi:outer membrane protein assembly factor BamB family protein [Cellulomonas alba]|uniref:PQQ-binding-like beta-propeller repeat protein n=1 Tax=Cellulomonas alba TaxID=3053467 RepID=A0ABT7SEB0_9CELL|nr:PQQ-binding-like beta-propeller repeat protein [Cellulomonas alba]MDM7854508.1 PQQ-binding-like beta-propeller repeat protein [Cellulomonas alba]
MARDGGAGRRMQAVELVEADARAAPAAAASAPPDPGLEPSPAARARRSVPPAHVRRALRRWWPVPVALALAAGAVQYGVDLHERHVDARYAAVPGFVDPVRPPVSTRWTGDGVVAQAVDRGTVIGTRLVGPSLAENGAVDVVGIDLRSGHEQWRTRVEQPDIRRGVAVLPVYLVVCAPVQSAAVPPRLVVCLSSIDVGTAGAIDGSAVVGPATTSRLFVLDAATGRTVRSFEVDAAEAVGAQASPVRAGATAPPDGGTAVLARGLDRGGADVWAVDLATGRRVWASTAAAPTDHDRSNGPAHVWVAAGQAVVEDGTAWATRFAVADGTLVATDGRWLSAVTSPDGARLWLTTMPAGLDPPGTAPADAAATRATFLGPVGVRSADGRAVDTRADDGSLPGLLLTDTGTIVGLDAATGDVRWVSSVDSGGVLGGATVLRGTVYVVTTTGVAALDGRTGRTRWSYDTDDGRSTSGLATDGRHLLALAMPLANQEDPLDVVALDPSDGHVAWVSAVPDGVNFGWAEGRVLLGWGSGIRRIG